MPAGKIPKMWMNLIPWISTAKCQLLYKLTVKSWNSLMFDYTSTTVNNYLWVWQSIGGMRTVCKDCTNKVLNSLFTTSDKNRANFKGEVKQAIRVKLKQHCLKIWEVCNAFHLFITQSNIFILKVHASRWSGFNMTSLT